MRRFIQFNSLKSGKYMYRYRSLLLSSFFAAVIVAGYSWLNFTPANTSTDTSISSAGFSVRFGGDSGYRSYPRYSSYGTYDRNYDYNNYYYYQYPYNDGYTYYYTYPYSDYNYQYHTYPRYQYNHNNKWNYRGGHPQQFKQQYRQYRHR